MKKDCPQLMAANKRAVNGTNNRHKQQYQPLSALPMSSVSGPFSNFNNSIQIQPSWYSAPSHQQQHSNITLVSAGPAPCTSLVSTCTDHPLTSDHTQPIDQQEQQTNQAAASSNPVATSEIIYDTGSTIHIFNQMSYFTSLAPLPHPITVNGMGSIKLTHGGVAIVHFLVDNDIKPQAVTGAYAPFLKYSILSGVALKQAGFTVTEERDRFNISQDGDTRMVAEVKDGLLIVRTHPPHPSPVLPVTLSAGPSTCGEATANASVAPAPDPPLTGQCAPPVAPLPVSATPAVTKPFVFDAVTLHRRLCHLSESGMKLLKRNGVIFEGEIGHCDTCALTKAQRAPFPARDPARRTDKPLFRIHADLMGPLSPTTDDGCRWILSLTCEGTGFHEVITMRTKDDAFPQFVAWHRRTTTRINVLCPEHRLAIAYFRSDNGGEFTGRVWQDYFDEHGIRFTGSIPYTPQQNGVAERFNRTLLNKMRPVLLQSGLPRRFWGVVAKHAALVTNLSPSTPHGGKTPQELWPDKPWWTIRDIFVLGCEAIVWQPGQRRDKLDPTAVRGVYLGPDHTHKAHRVLDLSSGRVMLARPEETTIHENVFPFREHPDSEPQWTAIDGPDQSIVLELGAAAPPPASLARPGETRSMGALPPPLEPVSPLSAIHLPSASPPVPFVSRPVVASEGEMPQQSASDHPARQSVSSIPSPVHHDSPSPSHAVSPQTEQPQNHRQTVAPPRVLLDSLPAPPTSRRILPQRDRRPPQFLSPNDGELFWTLTALLDQTEQTSINTYLSSIGPEFTDYKDVFCFLNNTNDKDLTLSQAFASNEGEQWRAAAQAELDVIKQRGVFSLVDLPPGRTAIPLKWVLRRKLGPQGELLRHKARLVVMGFLEKEGIDYQETFAPVGSYRALRVLLALSARFGLHLHQFDVKNAFLYGDLNEEIYVHQPQGFTDGSPRVWRLHKALYGLHQGPICWHRHFEPFILSLGFQLIPTEPSIYVLRRGTQVIVLWDYVDDGLIGYNSRHLLDTVLRAIRSRYEITETAEPRQVLGMRIQYDPLNGTLSLDQSQFIRSLLARVGLSTCNGLYIPADPNDTVTNRDCPTSTTEQQTSDKRYYQSIVGALIHAVNGTRSDICLAVNQVARFCSNPGKQHWALLKRILRYLRLHTDYSIVYRREPTLPLVTGYCDSTWGTSVDDRISVTGYVFFMAGGPVSWCTRKQASIALSSMEAEIMAAAAAAQEALALRSLLFGLSFPWLTIPIFIDNDAARLFGENQSTSQRSKHIDIRYFAIRDWVKNRLIELHRVPGQNNIADLFTKPLPVAKFAPFRAMLLFPRE